MNPTVDIIIIGHLTRNAYWNETAPVRPPLATTALIRSPQGNILVDPSAAGDLMTLRLFERSGLTPDRIDAVFLTSLHPTHRRGLSVFDDARWYTGEKERDAVAGHLQRALESDETHDDEEIERELALVGRTEPAPENLMDKVHLFPCPGVSPGGCGLLVTALQTTVIAGDAVLTRDHFEHAAVGEQAADEALARQSLADIYEVADLIVPGHDNVFCPATRMMAGI